MQRASLILILVLVFPAASGLMAADDAIEEAARVRYADAFSTGVRPKERVEILTKLVKECPGSRWADDALWILAEIAQRSGQAEQAIKHRLSLVARPDKPKLESYTESLDIYALSRIPRVVRLLELTGRRYSRKGKRVLTFNPLPMVTHEDIALGYERLRDYEAAIRHYRLALPQTPKGGLLRRQFGRHIVRLEKKQATKKRKQEQQDSAAEGEEAEADSSDDDGQKEDEAETEGASDDKENGER